MGSICSYCYKEWEYGSHLNLRLNRFIITTSLITINKDFLRFFGSMTTMAKFSTLLIDSSIAPTSELGLY
jgi:hypothetical protein